MTHYAVYDESGTILQANKIFGTDQMVDAAGKPTTYDALLNERGLRFVREDKRHTPASHEHWMVDTSVGRVKERPQMGIVYTPMVKAGVTTVISNIPKGARVEVCGAGAVLYSEACMPDTSLDFITEPVPFTYTVVIRLWPYKDCVIQIEAAAK